MKLAFPSKCETAKIFTINPSSISSQATTPLSLGNGKEASLFSEHPSISTTAAPAHVEVAQLDLMDLLLDEAIADKMEGVSKTSAGELMGAGVVEGVSHQTFSNGGLMGTGGLEGVSHSASFINGWIGSVGNNEVLSRDKSSCYSGSVGDASRDAPAIEKGFAFWGSCSDDGMDSSDDIYGGTGNKELVSSDTSSFYGDVGSMKSVSRSTPSTYGGFYGSASRGVTPVVEDDDSSWVGAARGTGAEINLDFGLGDIGKYALAKGGSYGICVAPASNVSPIAAPVRSIIKSIGPVGVPLEYDDTYDNSDAMSENFDSEEGSDCEMDDAASAGGEMKPRVARPAKTTIAQSFQFNQIQKTIKAPSKKLLLLTV